MALLNRSTDLEPNRPITLAETDIIRIDGQRTDIPVRVVFQLHPSPRVVIESQSLSGLARGKHCKKIELGNGAKLEVQLGSLYFDPEKTILIPDSQPANVIDRDSRLKNVFFAILNFPQFYGQQDQIISEAEQWVRIPHSILKTPEWSINITGVRNVGEVVKILRRTRGHGLTYTGSVTRSDGTMFGSRDVEQLLEALRLFFSIVRGAACSLALIRGRDEMGQEPFVRWGAHHSEPWLDFHSAFPRVHSNILSDLFPEFWTLLKVRDDKRRATLRAFDWYLQSNVSAPYIGTILTFAALEAFSFLLQSKGQDGTKKKGQGGSDRDRLENALSSMQIPLDLPNSCSSLRGLRKWDTGPQALVAIRNNLVHPQKNLGGVSNKDYWEAWHLGQWYFELMLLSRLGYQGVYRNRLAIMHRNEESITPVPWAPR